MVDFVSQSTAEYAQWLLGKKLLFHNGSHCLGGYIVETEAYLGVTDEAAHSYNGKRTPRVESMYQIGGTIYVYTMHGHNMMNIVMQEAGVPEGVLIRGLEPTAGVEMMMKNRSADMANLTNGPGKLTKALGITRAVDGSMINVGPVRLDLMTSRMPKEIKQSPRIGIPNKGVATDALLRFYVQGNPYVSCLPKSQLVEAEQTWL